MQEAAVLWEDARQAHARAKTLHVMVTACQQVATWIERAKKQANLGRPRAALDAVDEARTALTTPMSSLFSDQVYDGIWNDVQKSKEDEKQEEPKKRITSLEDTPFGRRAIAMLPKIENQVLMNARRGLNGWFLALRSGGDGAKAGRAVLRKCAHSMAVGPGSLGLGGVVPPSYEWRAKTADNLISRVDQSGSVARAVRLGYWFERDGKKEAELLEAIPPGMSRRAEAFAAAFGWYRCWDISSTLLVDPSEFLLDDGKKGLSGSQHGLNGSRHGSQRGQRTLGFRASAGSKAQNFRELSLGSSSGSDKHTRWAGLLTPSILFEDSDTRVEDEAKLVGLSESVHPVRRAEQAFSLLGKSEEFVQYYEQNRFGDTKIGSGKSDEEKGGKTSYLSSLTGDDVSVGTDRIFFAQRLPHLCASVVGFSAVEAALELGTFPDDDEEDKAKQSDAQKKPTVALSASRFRQSSERYERALVTELGTLLRSRAKGASLPELVRSSSLMAAFRSALRTVHPSSTTRRSDRELLAMDKDILMIALKVAQDEQLKATTAIMGDDSKSPMASEYRQPPTESNETIPDPEDVGLPFGLGQMKLDKQRDGFGQRSTDQLYAFSSSVPVVVRSIHARAIACAAFALNQEELGQLFPEKKKGNSAAGYVLDCVEECVNVAAVATKDSDNIQEESDIIKAVQVMANLLALQKCLPRLFGTLMRGMCHVGLIRSHEVDDTFSYAEKTLKGANKAVDAQVGGMYTMVLNVCKQKLDSHINTGLANYNWVAKAERDLPNAYCQVITDYLSTVFTSLEAMDEGSRNGLQISCMAHLSDRLVKLLTARANEVHEKNIPPIAKIDAFGIKNLSIDVADFIRFAESTGVQGLKDCFDELKNLTSAMLDRDLPVLLMPENTSARNKRYPHLDMAKVYHILEKYVGTGFVSQTNAARVPLYLALSFC
jgi:exocyst complex component 6